MVKSILRGDRKTYEVGVVDIFARVTFGSSGAPTLDKTQSAGVASITRNSAGDYTVVLTDGFQKLLCAKHAFDASGNSGTAPASPSMFVKAKSVNASGGGTIEVVFNAAGTATDPASGEIVLFHFVLKNSLV